VIKDSRSIPAPQKPSQWQWSMFL